jgi:hypothetical protein
VNTYHKSSNVAYVEKNKNDGSVFHIKFTTEGIFTCPFKINGCMKKKLLDEHNQSCVSSMNSLRLTPKLNVNMYNVLANILWNLIA